jgi:hypothetical protein
MINVGNGNPIYDYNLAQLQGLNVCIYTWVYTYIHIYICKYIVYTHSLFYLVPSAFDEAGGVQSKPRFHLRTPYAVGLAELP